MKRCPDCGADVPADGTFCPECGVRVAGGHGEHSDPSQSRTQTEDWRSQEDEDWDYPVEPTKEPRPEDHKLLLGSVLTLSIIGFVEGVVQALYPEIFLEFLEEEGAFGLEGELTAELFVITGTLGVIVSIAVIGATAYFYREGRLPKRYFWLLLGSGVAGFLLVGSLFLTILVIFAIYGLVSVSD